MEGSETFCGQLHYTLHALVGSLVLTQSTSGSGRFRYVYHMPYPIVHCLGLLKIKGGGGGGGGVHPDYFVKLDFEIAVDQQTRARDQTFEGVPDSG